MIHNEDIHNLDGRGKGLSMLCAQTIAAALGNAPNRLYDMVETQYSCGVSEDMVGKGLLSWGAKGECSNPRFRSSVTWLDAPLSLQRISSDPVIVLLLWNSSFGLDDSVLLLGYVSKRD